MTNPDMVKRGADTPGRKPNPGPADPPAQPDVLPPAPGRAPEEGSDPPAVEEPLDSPQPKPMIQQGKAGGLKASR